MNLSKENENKIIKQFTNLFIMTRKKYLVMNKKGEYTQKSIERNDVALNDGHIIQHLQGKKTIGVYAGDYLTKFICFDIDVEDKNLAKQTTYKVHSVLISLGIPEDRIYISSSGNKGYHIDIYFNKAVTIDKMRQLYDIVVEEGDLCNLECGEVEFRPTHQGLKLPLGINFKNKDKNNMCWYVDYDKGLEIIESYEYILEIKQINTSYIFEIINRYMDVYLEDDSVELEDAHELEETKGCIESSIKLLPGYKNNIDYSETIKTLERIETEGLKFTGTRHKSLFSLCKYYKHLGYKPKENEQMLIDWLHNQDTRTYKTSLNESYRDIKDIVKYIYDKDITITKDVKEVTITYSEMKDIMELKSKNDKVLTYSMLIHNKRYSEVGKVFYMTYPQMALATGLGERTVKRIVPKLEDNSYIEIVERNKMVFNDKNQFVTKKPNKYIMKLTSVENDIKAYDIDLTKDKLYVNTYNDCLLSLFDTEYLKNVLTKNQYYELINSQSQ